MENKHNDDNDKRNDNVPTASARTKVEEGEEEEEEEEERKKDKDRGLVGLRNLGNTCFMNASLQALSGTPPLRHYFASNTYGKELNATNPLGMEGKVALHYGALVKRMWPRTDVVTPFSFKSTIARFSPMFDGYDQHDAQELLAFVLDGLHEGLNRVLEKPYVAIPDSNGRADAQVSREHWEAHLQRNRSVIVDLFTAQLKSTLKLSCCGFVSTKFDPYNMLSLPLPLSGLLTLTLSRGGVSLEECFSRFVQPESLDGSSMAYCSKCKEHRPATKELQIWTTPSFLIIHLKRLLPTGKLRTYVDFPVTGLDISSSSRERDSSSSSMLYDLYGVVNHVGNSYGGHYYAYVARRKADGTAGKDWFCFDDDRVEQIGEDEIKTNAAYMLFYHKRVVIVIVIVIVVVVVAVEWSLLTKV
eukprot:jgi/Bigna1/39959/e_gw1.37.133.1